MGGTTIRPTSDLMSHPVIRDYLRFAAGDHPTGPADADLLARFAATRDETAFELLVWRHAGLIQRVCKGVLGDHHAAEDAAQAAFLILARKAHTFAGRGSVIGWLYRISRRVAIRLAKDRTRHLANSSGLDRIPVVQRESATSIDEVEALCGEIDRLPERYRVPVLLCFFEGLTHAEAARRTGWAIGTVAGRLARAKDLLARRLSRKGVGMASVVLTLPAGNFVGNTVQAAAAFAVRGVVVPGIEPTVSHLAEGILKAMTATKLKFAATAALVCIAVTTIWAVTPNAQREPGVTQIVQTSTIAHGNEPQQKEEPKQRTADAEQRKMSQKNLKEIALGFHNYASKNGDNLPHDITDKDGKPLLSWRVAILPYIDEEELFKEFKLDEPWDSEHNKKALTKMPEIYRIGFGGKNATKTYYQVFSGPGAPFERGKTFSILIPDGTSNTLAAVEAGPPVEWTKPADIAYDSKKPFRKLELPFKNVFSVAFLDGSTWSMKPNLDESILRLLIEHDDGQPIPDRATLQADLPLTQEELTSAQDSLKENERLIDQIGKQLHEQQRLLVELGKISPPLSIGKAPLSKLTDFREELVQVLRHAKKETEELQNQLENAAKK